MDGVPQAMVDGKIKYRRVLIQRVYPEKITEKKVGHESGNDTLLGD